MNLLFGDEPGLDDDSDYEGGEEEEGAFDDDNEEEDEDEATFLRPPSPDRTRRGWFDWLRRSSKKAGDGGYKAVDQPGA